MEKVNIDSCLFIYSKGSSIKVFNLEDDKKFGYIFIKNGWNHTATIDPCSFIEYLAKCNDEDIFITVKNLKNKLK